MAPVMVGEGSLNYYSMYESDGCRAGLDLSGAGIVLFASVDSRWIVFQRDPPIFIELPIRTARQQIFMATTRIIDCIGASDEDIAHLRLLLRTAKIHLRDIWHWGAELKADIVIVDTRSMIGESARRRTLERGIACAQLIEANAPALEGRHLRKPLRREDLVDLLNGVGGSTVAPLAILTQGDDFFDLDLGEHEHLGELPSVDVAHRHTEVEREHEAFEAMFRRDPLEHKPQFLMPDQFDSDVGIEYIGETTARSESRAVATGNPFAREDVATDSIDPSFRRDMEAREIGATTHALADYLSGRLLGGFARIQLPGVPELVLDPKEQVYHAQSDLRSLEAYVREPLRMDAWDRLVNFEMAAIRERMPAKPYSRLQWMARYITSDGYLAAHLDPGGSYRLTRWLELAHDYPRAFRIGAQMLKPMRLDEIARASGATIAEVFDVINAYDAIGYVEWTHREIKHR